MDMLMSLTLLFTGAMTVRVLDKSHVQSVVGK